MPVAMPIPVDHAGNTTGIIGSPSPGMEEERRHRRPTRDLRHHPGRGSCRTASGLPHTARTTSPHTEPRATRTARTVPASSPEPAAAGRPRRPPRAADSAGPGADCRLRSRQPTRRPDLQSTSGTPRRNRPWTSRKAARVRYVWTCRSPLNHDAFDLVERDRVRRPVVQLRRLRRRVAGDPLRVLERPAVRQIRRDGVVCGTGRDPTLRP